MSEQILDKIKELRAEVEKLSAYAKSRHYYCEYSWYSCPKAEVGCANEVSGELLPLLRRRNKRTGSCD